MTLTGTEASSAVARLGRAWRRLARAGCTPLVLLSASCSSPPAGALERDAGESEAERSINHRRIFHTSFTGSAGEMGASRDAETNDARADAAETDGDTRSMLTLDWTGAAVFHDAVGNELGRANAPARFPLPDGGSVTFGIAFETFTILDVPQGATLRPFIDLPFPVTQQSIRIDVPDRPGMDIVANTGCSTAAGAGMHLMVMDDGCMENGKAELFITAWKDGAGAYIVVKDIALGTVERPPLDVALPGWTDLPAGDNRVRLDSTGLAEGLTGAVGLYAVRGQRSVIGRVTNMASSEAGLTTSIVDALLPTLGTRWIRTASSYPKNPPDLAKAPRSYRTETLAHPLASPGTIDFGTLLPAPTDLAYSETSGPAITFNLPAVAATADIDRIAVTFAWGDPMDPLLWHVVTKPQARRVELPRIPDYIVTPHLNSLLWVEVRVEDHPNVQGWINVLKDWHDTYLFLGPERWPSGRISRSIWQSSLSMSD